MQRRELFGFLSSSLSQFGNEVKEESQCVVRPPYFKQEDDFGKECRECEGVCATLCQEQIIVIAEDKTPYLDFSKRGCTYCDECAIGCPKDVLTLEAKQMIPFKIEINQERCLSWQGVMCFSCKDPCLENAIDFQAMFMPIINDKCTSCGFCIGRCPAEAIDILKVG